MVNRAKANYGDMQVPINSLGYIGLLSGKDRLMTDEIINRKPVTILSDLAVPVFGKNSNNISATEAPLKTT